MYGQEREGGLLIALQVRIERRKKVGCSLHCMYRQDIDDGLLIAVYVYKG